MEQKLNVRVELEGEILSKFLKIQSRLGIKSAADVFRFLINDYYREKIEQQAQKPELTRSVTIE